MNTTLQQQIQYLQLTALLVGKGKQRTFELMRLQPGDTVLDVGCGPATDTPKLATLVGPTGQVIGVDADVEMVKAANQRWQASGNNTQVWHQLADAAALPFASGQFAACRSERLFIHLVSPAATLSEMSRVTKPGGIVVVADPDWGTLSIATTETAIERRLVQVQAELCMRHGFSGRELYGLFKQQGLQEVGIEMHSLWLTNYPLARSVFLLAQAEQRALEIGAITDQELQTWHTSLQAADARGEFFGSVTAMIASGRVPANNA